MDIMNEKLNTFSSLVMRDASGKREGMIDSMQKKHDAIIAEKEAQYREEASTQLQLNTIEAKKKENQQVLQAELDAKKQLLLYRDSIINEVMLEVSDKLKEFMKTDEYREWLMRRTERALLEVGKGSKLVYVSGDDLKYKDEIIALSEDYSTISVQAADEKDFIGGVKVFNPDRRVSVDYSFKEMLAEEKKDFLTGSGLTIE
ncbi:MAG: V-type ATP synthase subunit E family protein [Clostridiales bacterium]|nr:V-type ATP synthase subunit E family protein [Clostridiales bacterium]